MSMLVVDDLKTYFRTEDGLVRAVDGVSFSIDKGEVFALVGESGCGKSVTAFSVMRILQSPPGYIAGGSITIEGTDLLKLSERRMRDIRGGRIAMIFQEPMTSLNPVFTCGTQIVEAIRLHRGVRAEEAKKLAVELLAKVGIPEPAQRFDEYPHQLSGGMRQRVMIAMALSCNPRLLIADEPTTALDVTIQAQILELLKELVKREGLGVLLITHDLGVVAETADTVAVMYAGRIVEKAKAADLFARPLHPYTAGLFRSIPRLGRRQEKLPTIAGGVPDPLHFPPGCPFHPRCELTREKAAAGGAETAEVVCDGSACRVLKRCTAQRPELRAYDNSRSCACWESGVTQ